MSSRGFGFGFPFTRTGILLTTLTLLLSACSGASVIQTTTVTYPTETVERVTTPIPTNVAAVSSPTSLPQTRPTVAAISTPTQIPPVQTPTSGQASFPALQRISMQDVNNGWGLSQEAVFYTTDGGQSWRNVTPKNGWLSQSIVKGFFLNKSTAWLIQPDKQDFNNGTLYRTLDGGQTWNATKVPFGPNSLQFLNTDDGWVMADRGAAAGSMAVDIYKTRDGGMTWNKVQSAGPQSQDKPGSLPFGGDKSEMAFKDMQDGWIGGSQPIIGHSYLYRTTDGGKTWAFQDLTIPAAYSSSSVLTFAPKFFTGQDGVLPVSLETQVQSIDFYITNDGGQTWQSTAIVQSQDAYDIASMQDIWVWSGKTLDVSHNSAQSWTSIMPETSLQGKIQQLDFINQKTGWAISMDAQENIYLYQTEDGGNTWDQLSK